MWVGACVCVGGWVGVCVCGLVCVYGYTNLWWHAVWCRVQSLVEVNMIAFMRLINKKED